MVGLAADPGSSEGVVGLVVCHVTGLRLDRIGAASTWCSAGSACKQLQDKEEPHIPAPLMELILFDCHLVYKQVIGY